MQSNEIPGDAQVRRLWNDAAPLAGGTADADVPSLTFYRPTVAASGAAIICCPGGGYDHLAWEKEGVTPGRWLAGLGILGVALKYRYAPYRHPAPLLDAARAMRTLRANASAWKIDPNRIGILGFSAGGHLATTLCTRFDEGNPSSPDPIERVSSRPDRCILLYAGTSAKLMGDRGRNNLFGPNHSEQQLDELANEKFVTAKTPPTFFFYTVDDGSVKIENAMQFAAALRKNSVAFEMHLFEHGRHGVGLAAGDPVLGVWPNLCANWLKLQGYVEK